MKKMCLVFLLILFQLGCKKSFQCKNLCYKCNNPTYTFCSDQYPTSEMFLERIDFFRTQGRVCTETEPNQTFNTKSKELKEALGVTGYDCVEKK